MTLLEVAARFATAGVTPAERALRSLQRCKPARAPVYRDGDHYELDPHDDELDLWAFRLGLRPPEDAAPLGGPVRAGRAAAGLAPAADGRRAGRGLARRLTLVDKEGFAVDDRDVQLARLAATKA